MKKLAFILITVLLMINCSESIVGPINPTEPISQDTLSATVQILNWSQEYTDGTYTVNGITYTRKYDDIQVIYIMENTGNIDIENYELWFGFEAYDSTISPITEYKDLFKKFYNEINISGIIQDTINFSSYERYIPVIKIECAINALNF